MSIRLAVSPDAAAHSAKNAHAAPGSLDQPQDRTKEVPMVATRFPQVAVYSFGFLHDANVPAWHPALVADVRHMFRDPHHDPAFRQLTGRDDAVRTRVLSQPGAVAYVYALADAITAGLGEDTGTVHAMRSLAIGCAGGRHRSVVLADSVTSLLLARGLRARVLHLHIDRPVVDR
ncbi:RapZ C-terminal domain-containing protein [Amycolatopsis sp. NPDC054798]